VSIRRRLDLWTAGSQSRSLPPSCSSTWLQLANMNGWPVSTTWVPLVCAAHTLPLPMSAASHSRLPLCSHSIVGGVMGVGVAAFGAQTGVLWDFSFCSGV